jgi:hypothetical protein
MLEIELLPANSQSVKNLSFFYRSRRCIAMFQVPPLDSILSQLNPVHAITHCLFKIQFNILPSIPRPLKRSHMPDVVTYNFVCILDTSLRVPCPTHVVPYDLIVVIICVEDYELSVYSLNDYLHPPIYFVAKVYVSITVTTWCMMWTVFARSDTGVVVRLPLEAWMSLCVLCVDSGLTTGWSPVQGVLPNVYRIKKLKKRPRSKGLYGNWEKQKGLHILTTLLKSHHLWTVLYEYH